MADLNVCNACPLCGAQIHEEENLILNELLICSTCGTELEVVSTDPLIVVEAQVEDEDWGQ